jgi:hypothetical protein
MVPDQMVCIVAPASELAPASASVSDELWLRLEKNKPGQAELDAMFKRLGKVHFASFALLPPLPGENSDATSALLLELAVDDGLRPVELVELLVQYGFKELWAVYRAYWKGGEQASELARRDWLRGFLLRHLHRANGGFVGQRDRSVGQIQAEARLFEATRAELYQHPAPPTQDRASAARAISDWAAARPEFRWAIEPARRSFWRSAWMTPLVRFPLALAGLAWGLALVAVLLNVLAIIAFTGVLTLAVVLAATDLQTVLETSAVFGRYSPWSRYAIEIASSAAFAIALITWIAVRMIRALTVAAFFLLIFGIGLYLGIIGVYLYVGGTAFIGFIGASGVLVCVGFCAALGVALAWLAIAALFLAAVIVSPPYLGLRGVIAVFLLSILPAAWLCHVLLGWLVACAAAIGPGLFSLLQQRLVLGLPAIDAIAILLFILFSGIAFLISRWTRLPPFAEQATARNFDRLTEDRELPAAHQVHPSIDACTADLAAAGKPSHMFSLTDVRRPNWLKSLALRFFLWLVTYVGHTVFTEGRLANAEGIRFGHWHVLDGGRRLLFCSNFDGAFGGYLDEFINGASEGVNLFWRWTVLLPRRAAVPGQPEVTRKRKFPPTCLWVFKGCKYEQWFKTYARDSMLPHIYRFEAYDYSAKDVERATRLREALFGLRTAVNDDKVMRALES